MLRRRTAERNAAHLLPLLTPGMDLLDLGSGPGAITLGLAKAVYPGTATGLDHSPEQVGLAKLAAKVEQVENARFMTGDALDLPFPDNSLDVVHCHGFLMHSPRIREQLSEIMRALKPGGIVSSREMDVPSSFIAPVHESNQGMWEMLGEIISGENADPWMGRHLKTFLANAGFENVRAGYDADVFDSPEEVEFLAEFLLDWGLSQEFEETASASPGDFRRWREQVAQWRDRRGAVGCFHFGHAVGRKPVPRRPEPPAQQYP